LHIKILYVHIVLGQAYLKNAPHSLMIKHSQYIAFF